MFDFLLDHDALSAIIAFGLVLIPAVLVHEFGHFIAARMVGITVLEFGIGFPPRARKLFTWKETEFTLNWLPIGGFVRPLGEDMVRPLSEEETERERQAIAEKMGDMPEKEKRQLAERLEQHDTYRSDREELAERGVFNTMAVHEAKPLPRIFFMVAGAGMNFVFAFLVFVVVGMLGLSEDVGDGVHLPALSTDAAWAESGLQEGDTIVSINDDYLESTEDLVVQLEGTIGQLVTLQVQRDLGETTETIDLEITPTEAMVAPFYEAQEFIIMITSVDEESPAYSAGFLFGDLIIAFDETSLVGDTDTISLLQELTTDSAGQEVTLTVLRDGEMIDLTLVPRVNPPDGRGRMGIGIGEALITGDMSFAHIGTVHYDIVSRSLGSSLGFAADRIATVFKIIGEFPQRLLSDDTQPEERRIVSPVGVSQMGGKIVQNSIEEDRPTLILDYIALISIALGFTNLLPIPALDGGRVVFVLIEMVRGKPVAPEREGMVHLMGLLFMLSIGVIFIINDIMNPLTDIIP
jgi:regulator of sigma E protease